jgi:hypothetical protein
VKRGRADVSLLGLAVVTTVAPELLAIVKLDWSCWTCDFLATASRPTCGDALFTVVVLLITSVFLPQFHGLAGGMFNAIGNIEKSAGFAVTSP